MYKIIDVSSHNGCINWADVQKSGDVDGVIIRGGYIGKTDDSFTWNIAECNRLGIPCGVYWFCYSHTIEGAKADALELLDLIRPYRVELPIFYDFEYDTERFVKERYNFTFDGYEGRKLRTDIIKTFCSEVEKAGYYCGYYSNADYLTYKLIYEDLKRFDLWLAQWDNKESAFPCGICQRGTKKIKGVSNNVDYNETERNYVEIIKKAGLNNLCGVREGDKAKIKLNESFNFMYETPLDVISTNDKITILGLNGQTIAVVDTKNVVKV